MRVPDDERLFRFVEFDDYEEKPGIGGRIRSSLFFTRRHEVSVNLGSIWPLAQNLAVCPTGYGLCSLTAGEARSKIRPERGPFDIIPQPVDPDPLLGIHNPSHANFSRLLHRKEAQGMAEAASLNIHRVPHEPG